MNPTEIVNSIAPTAAPSVKKQGGALRRFFDIWGDPEKRDTSGWNVYYYYYRQIAQHTAAISLKRMKWIAVIFQLYFFLHMILPFLASIYRKGFLRERTQDIMNIGMFVPPLLLTIVAFLIPTIMVGNAFKVTQTARGLMTSRAKEPPLLAHLSLYTTNSGMVAGALQSLIYTWCRFMLYLTPAILVLAGLWAFAILVHQTPGAFRELGLASFTVGIFQMLTYSSTWVLPCLLVFLATASVFFTMQFLCYRLDTLALMIFLGWLAVAVVVLRFDIAFSKGPGGILFTSFAEKYATTLFITACLFGIAYFPLAAADTMDYGLGNASRWLRTLQVLMAALGVYAFVLFGNLIPESSNASARGILAYIDRMAFTWALLGVSGLLADSLALASPRAKNLCRLHASRSFLSRCFDVSSPRSLLPIVLVEWLLLLFTVCLLGEYQHAYGSFARDVMIKPGPMPFLYFWRNLMSPENQYARALAEIGIFVWGVIHFALAVQFRLRRSNPQMKPAWKFFVQFNGIVMVSLFIGYIFLGGLLRKPFWFIVFYVASLIVLFSVARDRDPSTRKKKESARS